MSKRERFAQTLNATGVLRLMETLPSKPQLLTVNHHRIGDRDQTSFDPGVFSASQDGLEEQLNFLKKNYDVIAPRDVGTLISGARPQSSTAVLLTFDDGYLDNYELALPVLEACDVEAVFFLVPSFLDNPYTPPWWDEIAKMTRQAVGKTDSAHAARGGYNHPDSGHALPRYRTRAEKLP